MKELEIRFFGIQILPLDIMILINTKKLSKITCMHVRMCIYIYASRKTNYKLLLQFLYEYNTILGDNIFKHCQSIIPNSYYIFMLTCMNAYMHPII